jgi:hypothetical protein
MLVVVVAERYELPLAALAAQGVVEMGIAIQ